jgi:DNA invertase Pin-like site-specific DNA recombinase
MVSWLKKNRSCRTVLVEKTDRLYRNFRDVVTLEDLDVEIHLVKEGQVVSNEAKSQTKLIHGLNVVLARNYSENLKEEVKKGMREKAASGVFPGHAPFGYRNDKATRTIAVDPTDSPMLVKMMEMYATGAHTLSTIHRMLRDDYGKTMSRANVHLILRNQFYIGKFTWGGQEFGGNHPLIVDPNVFERVQEVLQGHNRPKPSKRDVSFRGLMTCAHDGCMLTGDVQKEKYVYYRCSGNRGKCALPRFKEEVIADRLGEPPKGLQIPEVIAAQIVSALRSDQGQAAAKADAEQSRLQARLTTIRNRMDSAYLDKLDGKISEAFWERKSEDWRMEERSVLEAIAQVGTAESGDRALDARRVFELANKAHFLYISQGNDERGKLLRMLCSNFSVDAVSVTPEYRYPFNRIFERAKTDKWSGRLDSN